MQRYIKVLDPTIQSSRAARHEHRSDGSAASGPGGDHFGSSAA